MLGLYYRIWVDLIIRARKYPENKRNWPVVIMIFMTMAMSFNFLLIDTLLEKFVFKRLSYSIYLPDLPSRLNDVLTYLVLFILPCFLINYFFIFRNKRYEKLLQKYPYYNGKLGVGYLVISMMLPIVLLLGGIILGGITLSKI